MSRTPQNTSSRDKLDRDLRDPEQRRLMVSAQIRNGIPLQLRAMREDREWTQAALAMRLGTTQNAVSRLESPKSSAPTIKTLQRIAEVFDVALIVKFAPFSQFIDDLSGLSRTSVAVPSYDNEREEAERERVVRARQEHKRNTTLDLFRSQSYLEDAPPETEPRTLSSFAAGAQTGYYAPKESFARVSKSTSGEGLLGATRALGAAVQAKGIHSVAKSAQQLPLDLSPKIHSSAQVYRRMYA